MTIDLKKIFSIFLYFLPFFIFALGYFIPLLIFSKKTIEVPNIVGKSVSEGLLILADKKLDLRLLRTQEEANIPEGTIIYQTPQEKSLIKQNQHIFIAVSTKPKTQVTPNFEAYSKEKIIEWCNKYGKVANIYWLNSNQPRGKLIAQSPAKEEAFEEQNLRIYMSNGQSKICLMPDFKNRFINEVKEFLNKHNIAYEVICKNESVEQSKNNFLIEDQHPKPGAIVDLSRKLFVQLYASSLRVA